MSTINKTLISLVVAAFLSGCGGGSSDPEVKPPSPETEKPNTDLPLTDLNPSIPVKPPVDDSQDLIPLEPSKPVPPTEPDQPLIPLEPAIPVTPPTTDCGDNGACLEDDFINPSEKVFNIAEVAEMLNVDQTKLTNICNNEANICHMVEDKPVITVKNYWYADVSYFPMQGYALMNGELQTNKNYCAESFNLKRDFWNTSGHHVTDVKTEIVDCNVKYQAIIDLNPDDVLNDILGQRASYLILSGDLTYQGFSSIHHSDTQWLYVGGTESGNLNDILEIMSVDRRSNQ
ncbi:TPA: hypothetical protein ACX6Q0_003706 [Photobacterium damselae]